MSAPRASWAPVTPEVEPASFRERVELEDFVVEELPLFEPSGTGDHLVCVLDKRGLDTPEALRRLARALGRSPAEFGYAGRKDARACTRQRISLEHADPERLRALELPGLRVEPIGRHARKLRLGELAGNRFRLRLREVGPENERRVRRALELLAVRGLANGFGPQRFGREGDNALLGGHLARGDAGAYLAALARGAPPWAGAALRAALEGGRGPRRTLARLADRLGPDLGPAARQLARRPDDLEAAAAAVPGRARRFHLGAWQAEAFEAVLAERVRRGWFGRVLPGDLVLVPEDPRPQRASADPAELAALQARADRFEAAPTGPLPGPRAPRPDGEPGDLERSALERLGIAAEPAWASRLATLPGSRRALRVPIRELEIRARGSLLELDFTLPPGSYATALLLEIRKGPGRGVS